MKVVVQQLTTGLSVPLYSCSVQPNGDRIACGSNDGRIRIWRNVDEKGIFQLRAQLLAVFGQGAAINCVRWSHKGNYLASASDDGTVIIWTLHRIVSEGEKLLGSDEIVYEEYKQVAVFQGHTISALGVSWSPNDARLATCSVDNKINVWDVQEKQLLMTLSHHQGHVKGVAWDPLDKYILSQGEDGCFATSLNDKKPTQLGKDMVMTNIQGSLFLRPSWSPDGAVVSAVNAKNFEAICFTRDKWSVDNVLKGHEGTICCSDFSPKILRSTTNNDKQEYIVAVCSKDNGVSLWRSGTNVPIFASRNIFTNSPQDISWSSDGTTVFMCSSDGSLKKIQIILDQGMELVEPNNSQKSVTNSILTIPESSAQFIASRQRIQQQKQQEMRDAQTVPAVNQINGTGKSNESIPHPVQRLSTQTSETNAKQSKESTSNNESSTTLQDLQSSATTPAGQSIEITSKGKKRIRPVTVEPSQTQHQAPVSNAVTAAPQTAQSKAEVDEARRETAQLAATLSVTKAASENFYSETQEEAKKHHLEELKEDATRLKRKLKHRRRNDDGDDSDTNTGLPHQRYGSISVLSQLFAPCTCASGTPSPIVPVRIDVSGHENKLSQLCPLGAPGSDESMIIACHPYVSTANNVHGTRVTLEKCGQRFSSYAGKCAWSTFVWGTPEAVAMNERAAVVVTRDPVSRVLLANALDVSSGTLLSRPLTLNTDDVKWLIVEQTANPSGYASLITANGDLFFFELPTMKPVLKHTTVTSISALVQPSQAVVNDVLGLANALTELRTKQRESGDNDGGSDESGGATKGFQAADTYHALVPHRVEDFTLNAKTRYPQVLISYHAEESTPELPKGMTRRAFALDPATELWTMVFDSAAPTSQEPRLAPFAFAVSRPYLPAPGPSKEFEFYVTQLKVVDAFAARSFTPEMFKAYALALLERKDQEKFRYLLARLTECYNTSTVAAEQTAVEFTMQSIHSAILANGTREFVQLAEEWNQCFEEFKRCKQAVGALGGV